MEQEIIIYLLGLLQLILIGFLTWLGSAVIELQRVNERLVTLVSGLERRMEHAEANLAKGDKAFEENRRRLDVAGL